ncbi:MAG: GNAT family N-acyltransferase [Bdellovibrionales bacterium]|nr:GNAT family N-acyltransferase [Bdellovibrionales bacterium]
MAKGRIRSAIKKKIRGAARVGASGSGAAESSAGKSIGVKPSKRRRLKAAAKVATTKTKNVTAKVASKVTGTMATQVLTKIGTMKEAIQSLDAQLKLHRFKIHQFEPKIKIDFQKGHFTVKTVENGAELEEVLRLRFEVFNREYMNTTRAVGVDVDKMDFICDHLIIRDNRIGRIVGTYRLNSSEFSDEFYSEAEFHFDRILDMPGVILELGRAAIAKEFRTGVVIALLWRGISEYLQKSGANIMLGCASVKTMDPMEIGLITHHLEKKGALTREFGVEPTKKYKVKNLDQVLEYIEKNPFEYNEEAVEKMVPPLFASYLKMGFKAYGEPALDKDFFCIDYLIMIRTEQLDEAYKRRYKTEQEKE